MTTLYKEAEEPAMHYINGIGQGDGKIITEVYNRYYTFILSYILKNSGTDEDARDIFQEALIVIYHNTCNHHLLISCRFSTYLYAVCRNLWLKELRKKRLYTLEPAKAEPVAGESVPEAIVEESRRYEVYLATFQRLSQECQKVLSLYFNCENMETIAACLNLSSTTYARKKKFRCKEQLVRNVKRKLQIA